MAGNTIYPTAPTGFGAPLDKTPTGDAYVIGTMHGDGSVQMNGAGGANAPYTENAGYNQTTWACDSAGCHGSAVKFIASTQFGRWSSCGSSATAPATAATAAARRSGRTQQLLAGRLERRTRRTTRSGTRCT